MKVKKSFFKPVVISLTIILGVSFFSLYNGYRKQRITNKDISIVSMDNGNVEVTNKIDSTTLKVSYDKSKDKYTLYKDSLAYDLNTKKHDNKLIIDLSKSDQKNTNGKVSGQCPLAIVLWTPALIEAAKLTIAATVAAVGTYTLWYTMDSIQQVIATDKVEVLESDKDVKNTYYVADLEDGKVVIEQQIDYEEALFRLRIGFSVFALDQKSALAVAIAASKQKKVYYDDGSEADGGFCPHYHPDGVIGHGIEESPRCWFPKMRLIK